MCLPTPPSWFLLQVQSPWAFSIRGLRLYFPELEPWVVRSALLLTVTLVYLCANVGPRGATHCSACPTLRHSESGPLGLSVHECGATGSASGQTACPAHSASLGPTTATGVLSTPVPISAPPAGLDECLFSISLVLVPLAVRFSVSSGCARRHSVSTYATILVLPQLFSY